MRNFIFISFSFLSMTALAQDKGDALSHLPSLFMKNVVCTGNYERDITISPDGNEIYYTIQHPKTGYSQIVFIKKSGMKWTVPQTVSFSGKYSDMEACFSPDGNKIYFASNRPLSGEGKAKDYDIWVTERKNGIWQTPANLGEPVNSGDDEFYPSIAKSGNIYFTATRKNGIGKEDIHVCKFENGKYSTSQPLDTNINSIKYEFNAYVSPDEDIIVFTSYGRGDDSGGGDLYFSVKKNDGTWTRSQNMGPMVNSPKLDYCPYISADRKTFYFTSERVDGSKLYEKSKPLNEFKTFLESPGNGNGDIYNVLWTW